MTETGISDEIHDVDRHFRNAHTNDVRGVPAAHIVASTTAYFGVPDAEAE